MRIERSGSRERVATAPSAPKRSGWWSSVCALLIALCAPCAWALPPGDIQALSDWSDLPVLGSYRLQEATNMRGPDAGRLRDVTPGRCVLLDEKGPGCITRISIFDIKGTLKVYFDGAETPEVDIPLATLYQAYPYYDESKWPKVDADVPQQFPFLLPLCTCGSAQQNACYVPMPFAKSVRVVLEHDQKNPWVNYAILLARYPEGTPVATFSAAGLRQREGEVRAVAQAWRNLGDPPRVFPGQRRSSGRMPLAGGVRADLCTLTGSGTIVGIRIRAIPWNRAVDRLLVLRAYWDGDTQPSVECPIGDLCASCAGARQPHCLPVGGGGKAGGYWCYFPMPFAKGARLTLENLSRHGIPALEYEIVYCDGSVAADAGRFCARWKREARIGDDGRYELLNAAGGGKLVGYNLYARGFKVPIANYRRDDRMAFYADGSTNAAIAGASLLMYFNHGYYTGPSLNAPLYAVPDLDNAIYGTCAGYRFFLGDAPQWTQSGRLAMEIKMDEDTGRDFSSAVLWYRATDGTASFPALTREDLMVPVLHYPGSVEAEDLAATAQFAEGDLTVVNDPDGRYGVGVNRYVAYAPLTYGDSVTLRMPVDKEGDYELRARLIAGPSGGDWTAAVNGAAADPKSPVFGCFGDETTVSWVHYPYGWANLGRFHFLAGENRLTFTASATSVGSRRRGLLLGVDAFLLMPAVKH